MSGRINVLDIGIDNITAKEAMKYFIGSMWSEPLGVIELVTVDSLMQLGEIPELKEDVGRFDLVLAGDTAILKSAGVAERQYIQETERQTFLRMLLRYLHKNHRRVYLLVGTEDEGKQCCEYLERYYRGIQIAGMAKVSAGDRADDMLVNAINGADTDCVISVMESPLQEDFAAKNRSLMNARVWLGLGKNVLPVGRQRAFQDRITRFLMRRIFQKEMEKRKREVSDMPSS